MPLSAGVSRAGQPLPTRSGWRLLWLFVTGGTQTQGVSSSIPNTSIILGKADFSFCHKECDTGDAEDISGDAEDN